MRRRHQVVAAFASLPLVLLAACGGGSTTAGSTSTGSTAATGPASASASAAPSSASGGGGGGTGSASELVVWADSSANTASAIEPLCQKWAEENGLTCTVKKFNGGDELSKALTQGNATGDVPDIFEGPHNGIGSLVKNGLIAPIDLASNKANFTKTAIDGVTYEGSTYAVPWGVENVALLTNKTLSPACPGTLDEAVSNAKTLIDAGTATKGLGIAMQIGDNGDGYHWNPLFTADGGYAYKQNADGSFDPKDLGIASPGGIAAAARLQKLANDGIISPSTSYDIAKESFAGGKSPYFITGPWSVPEMQKSLGDNLLVCPVPNWEGSQYTSQPFVGVRAFMEPAKAKNPVLASTFLNDAVMTTAFMDGMFSVDPRPPAWNDSYTKASADPIIKAFGDYGKQGIPMPNIPQMDNVFQDWGLAEFKVASGSDPTQTMNDAATSINSRNAAL